MNEHITDTTTEPEKDEKSRDQTDQVKIEILEEENARLREEYRRAKQIEYRRSAQGLLGVGLLFAVLSIFLTDVRSMLLGLGATGLFSGILVYYLNPEQLLPGSVLQSVINAYHTNTSKVKSELGLQQKHIFVPRSQSDDVRVYIPQNRDYSIPTENKLDSYFITTPDQRGIALDPVGNKLFGEYRAANAGEPDQTSIENSVAGLTDALVELFELAESVETTVQTSQVIFSVNGGPTTRLVLEHPVPSFLGVALAETIGSPVEVHIDREGDSNHIVCKWGGED